MKAGNSTGFKFPYSITVLVDPKIDLQTRNAVRTATSHLNATHKIDIDLKVVTQFICDNYTSLILLTTNLKRANIDEHCDAPIISFGDNSLTEDAYFMDTGNYLQV